MKSPTALFCALTTLAFSTTAFAFDPHVEAAKGKVEKTEDGQSLKRKSAPEFSKKAL